MIVIGDPKRIVIGPIRCMFIPIPNDRYNHDCLSGSKCPKYGPSVIVTIFVIKWIVMINIIMSFALLIIILNHYHYHHDDAIIVM